MPVADIIKAVTLTPAKAIGYEETIGVLEVGKDADVTVLEIVDREEMVEDAVGNKRVLKQIFQPKFVWRKGIKKDIL